MVGDGLSVGDDHIVHVLHRLGGRYFEGDLPRGPVHREVGPLCLGSPRHRSRHRRGVQPIGAQLKGSGRPIGLKALLPARSQQVHRLKISPAPRRGRADAHRRQIGHLGHRADGRAVKLAVGGTVQQVEAVPHDKALRGGRTHPVAELTQSSTLLQAVEGSPDMGQHPLACGVGQAMEPPDPPAALGHPLIAGALDREEGLVGNHVQRVGGAAGVHLGAVGREVYSSELLDHHRVRLFRDGNLVAAHSLPPPYQSTTSSKSAGLYLARAASNIEPKKLALPVSSSRISIPASPYGKHSVNRST